MRDKAKALYCKGGRTAKEIAEKLGVPLNTVKSWQKRDSWKEARGKAGGLSKSEARKKAAKEGATQRGKVAPSGQEVAPKKKRGAPKGSMNAVGHGAPKGNTNNLKHGAYSGLLKWGVLSDEEIGLIKEIAVDDTEAQLIQEVEVYTIREMRILRAIKKTLEKNKDGLEGTVTDSITASEKRLANDPKKKVGVIEMHSTKTSATNVILRMEKELSSVQRGKRAALQALDNYRTTLHENDNEAIVEGLRDMFSDIRSIADEKGKDTSE